MKVAREIFPLPPFTSCFWARRSQDEGSTALFEDCEEEGACTAELNQLG